MNQKIVDTISNKIITQLSKRNLGTLKTSTDLMNYINSVALGEGLDDFNIDYNEEYNIIFKKVKEFLMNKKTNMIESKKVMKEGAPSKGSSSIPTPTVMLNYEDDDAVAILKEVIGTFDDFELEKIQANGDKFYNCILCYYLDEMPEHFELMKYTYVQKLHAFKIDLFTELAKYLPVVNITLRSFEFIKNTEEIKFYITVLLSDTNIKDWVTGAVTSIERKEKQKILDKAKKKVTESSNPLTKKIIKESVTPEELVKGNRYYYEKPFSRRELLAYMGGGYSENYGFEFAKRNIKDGNGHIITSYIDYDGLKYLTPYEQVDNPNEIQEEQKPVEIKPTLPHHDLFGEGEQLDEALKLLLTESTREKIELNVIDAFSSLDKIRPLKGIIRANAITATKISIIFNNKKISVENIKQAISLK